MQGYTYVKGEHYPVEHLVFETAPEHVQEFLDVDHQVWTLGEATTDLFDHIPFLYKEVWVNDNKPGEMHFIFECKHSTNICYFYVRQTTHNGV